MEPGEARRVHGLAWAIFGLGVAVLGAQVFLVASAPPPPPGVEPLTGITAVTFPAAMLCFVAVGALLAARRPGNVLSWLLCAAGLVGLLSPATYVYAIHGFARPSGPLPLSAEMAWFTSWSWIPHIAFIGLILLLFPTGSLPSQRWRPVLGAALVGIAASLVLGVVLWPLRGLELLTVDDQFATAGYQYSGIAELAAGAALPLSFGSFVAGAVALIVRFRRAGEVERLQLKWLLYAAGLAASSLAFWALADVFGWDSDAVVADLLSSMGVIGIPVAIGIAVLRYRLYEIDRIISRTFSYALVTVVLASVYAGVVVGLRALLAPVTGESDLAVAGSTLTVAALFGPVRRRVQAFVNRHFNRRRYDAARAIESFGGRLRDRVQLEEVIGDVRQTVLTTLQPATMSVWVPDRQMP